MTAAFLRFQGVSEEDLDKVLNDNRFMLKQLDYLLLISMCDRGHSPSQLSRDRNLELII